jgi:hypothetical protein
MSGIDTKLSPKLSDYNGDGKKDILWRNYQTGNNSMWLMNGTTVLAAADEPGLSASTSEIAGFGDFNNDGKSDLLWRDYQTGDNTMADEWYHYCAAANLPSLTLKLGR